MSVPKRLDISEVRELLGDAAADKLVTAFLRRKAGQIVSITTDELSAAKRVLTCEAKTTDKRIGIHALGRVVMKRCSESKMVLSGLIHYIDELHAAAEPEPKPKTRAKRAQR